MAGILLSGVYNHYLTTYKSREATQSDTHKKDDLRNIYRSIVKSSQKNPVYLMNRDDHAETDAIDLKEQARALQHQLSSLGEIGREKALSSRSAYSSNPDYVEAEYIGDGDEEPPSFTVRVEHLATNQKNKGKALPDSIVRLAPGNYAFNIRMGEQAYELQYAVKPGDSNRDVQDRLTRLINKAGIGLDAKVETDEKGAGALTLTSRKTGLPPGKSEQFSITEESESGAKGTVEYFGLDRIEQNASDAQFKINGTTHTSGSNHFTVSRTYELNLKQVSGEYGEALIGVKNKQDSLIEHVHDLVGGYNEFLTNVQGIGSGHFMTGKILNETIHAAKNALSGDELPAGISIDEDGKLAVDEEKLHAAAEIPDDKLAEQMKPVRALAQSLYSMAKSVSLDPMQYITRPVVAYKNPEKAAPPNPYITSEYSGMLFNNYC
ncbi:MAG: hypothetical protein IK016_05755 [Lachnospiraceae bacterium]|nr:hypothetical protein [Lachnospiraceae bacterium]